jgi:hypothetical protein
MPAQKREFSIEGTIPMPVDNTPFLASPQTICLDVHAPGQGREQERPHDARTDGRPEQNGVDVWRKGLCLYQSRQQTSQDAGQKCCSKNRKRLMGHLSYGNNAMQIGQQRAANTETNRMRTHGYGRAYKIGGQTYREGTYYRIRGAAVNGEKYQKDQQQIGLESETRQHALL